MDICQLKNQGQFYITVFALLLLASCGPETDSTGKHPETKKNTVPEKARVIPPDFNADSAFQFVKTQSEFGPRIPGSKAHDKAVDYYQKKFSAYGAEVILQKGTVTTFDQKKWIAKNIIAQYNTENPNRILLCAHYDSRPFCDRDSITGNKNKACPGINDGASGVAVILEIARNIQAKKPNIGIDIILFDLEDYGQGFIQTNFEPMDEDWCLGSQYWAKNPHKPGYLAKFGILLDMVGAKDAKFPMEQASLYYAPAVVDNIWGKALQLGYGNYFEKQIIQLITDDHIYVNKLRQIPTVDIIDYRHQKSDFFQHHHKLSDNLDNIDKNTLKAVGQTVLEVIYNEN